MILEEYDAGLLGGHDSLSVEAWHDYIRSELGAAHDFYQQQVDELFQGSDDKVDLLSSVQEFLKDVGMDHKFAKQLHTFLALQLFTHPTPEWRASVSEQGPDVELEWSTTLLDGDSVDYEAAEKAVAELGPGWRLPTRQELESLLDLSRHDPAIDVDQFPDTKSDWYWTSTECAWNSDARWVVGFNGGSVLGYLRSAHACVRAVRPGQ